MQTTCSWMLGSPFLLMYDSLCDDGPGIQMWVPSMAPATPLLELGGIRLQLLLSTRPTNDISSPLCDQLTDHHHNVMQSALVFPNRSATPLKDSLLLTSQTVARIFFSTDILLSFGKWGPSHRHSSCRTQTELYRQ